MTQRTSDLFSKPYWLETVISRLPKCDILRVIDVASAFDVSVKTVYGWIEDGRLEGANVNAGASKRAMIYVARRSVIALAERIARGI